VGILADSESATMLVRKQVMIVC